MLRRPMNEMAIVCLVCLLLSFAAGCSCTPRERGTYLPVISGEAATDQMRTVLWFTGPAGEAVPVTRDLPADRARIWIAIEALCGGPNAGGGLRPSVPPGSHLRKVVHWPTDEPQVSAIDLDFSAMFGEPNQPQLDAINRTLSQFRDISSARVLIDGVPASPSQIGGAADQLLLVPGSARVPRQFIPVQAGARLYLAAREIAAVQPTADFAALAETLFDADYIRALLPRGSKVAWTETLAAGTRSVLVTIRLRRSKLTERDWQTVQTAADAMALTLRTIPDTAVVQVAVDGQKRVFTYEGAIWPNPESQ